MRKLMRYGKIYGGEYPQLIEGDLFRMIIKIPEFGEMPVEIPEHTQDGAKSTPGRDQVGTKSGPS